VNNGASRVVWLAFIPALTRSRPLARPAAGLRFRRIAFVAYSVFQYLQLLVQGSLCSNSRMFFRKQLILPIYKQNAWIDRILEL
jgi:hypothetical protein